MSDQPMFYATLDDELRRCEAEGTFAGACTPIAEGDPPPTVPPVSGKDLRYCPRCDQLRRGSKRDKSRCSHCGGPLPGSMEGNAQ